MKKYSLVLFLLITMSGLVSAQLVNNGGTITIQSGASLIVDGDITQSSGIIENNGTIELTGNMTNDGTYTAGAASKLITSGSSSSTLDMNGASVAILENSKTAGDVSLLSGVTVSEEVSFNGDSDVLLGDFNLTLEDGVSTNGSVNSHFVTDGIGTLDQVVPAAGSFTADVGDGTNYTPIAYTHTGTYTSSSIISSSVTDMKHPDAIADADDFLNRYWEVSTDITSPSLDMTGTYVAGDVTGTATDMSGARWENTEWEFVNGSQSGSTIVATTTETSSELTGMNFYGKADFKVFLEGPYTDDAMLNTINSSLPTTNPYDPSETGVTIPANAVDWVKVDIRESSANTTVVSEKAGFLLTDGSIVGTDGNQVVIKDASATTLVAVFHRNSLGVMTNDPIDFTTQTPMINFADGITGTFGTDAMKDMGNGIFALYNGDFDNNGAINANDLIDGWVPNNGQTFMYSTSASADFDLNGAINANDLIDIWVPNNSKTQQIPQ